MYLLHKVSDPKKINLKELQKIGSIFHYNRGVLAEFYGYLPINVPEPLIVITYSG